MATVINNPSDTDSSAVAWIVAIVAILAVAGIAIWAAQGAPFATRATTTPGANIDVNVPAVNPPTTNQGGNINPGTVTK
ncbi:MAG: hypothetical protein JWM56_1283 [Candidatus Peribacteria bacterium]|nr:hypothetical protein [Candidatus Peribacteria bacterium]